MRKHLSTNLKCACEPLEHKCMSDLVSCYFIKKSLNMYSSVISVACVGRRWDKKLETRQPLHVAVRELLRQQINIVL